MGVNKSSLEKKSNALSFVISPQKIAKLFLHKIMATQKKILPLETGTIHYFLIKKKK